MQFLKNTKLRSKMFIVFTVILLLFAIGFVTVYFMLSTINRNVGYIYHHGLLSVEYLVEADRDAYQSTLAISHGLVAARDNEVETLQEELSTIRENAGQVDMRFGKFEAIYIEAENPDLQHVETFHEYFSRWNNDTERIISLISAGRLTEAEEIYFGGYAEDFSVMRDSMDQLTGISLENAEADFESSEANYRSILFTLVIIMAIVILVSIVFGAMLTKSITGPISRITHITERIGKGDLMVDIDESLEQQKDEMGI